MIRLLLGLLLLLVPGIVRAEACAGPDVVLVPGLTSSPGAWTFTVKAVPGCRWHLVQVKGFAGTAADPVAFPATSARFLR